MKNEKEIAQGKSLFSSIPKEELGLRIRPEGNFFPQTWTFHAITDVSVTTVEIIPKRNMQLISVYASVMEAGLTPTYPCALVLTDIQNTLSDDPQTVIYPGTISASKDQTYLFDQSSGKMPVNLVLYAGVNYKLEIVTVPTIGTPKTVGAVIEYKPV